MNDKDKEAFEKWWDEIRLRGQSTFGIVAITWKAACEYKKEEYSNIMDAMTQTSQYNSKLQAENAKLIECVEFYANGTHWDLDQLTDPSDIEEINVMNRRIEYSSGKRARQVLKELEER